MQSIRIQLSSTIIILPENSHALPGLDLEPLDVLAVVIDTLEESRLAPFGCLRAFDAGEDGGAALAFGDEVGKDGGFAVAGSAHAVVFVGVEPVVVFAEKVPSAVSSISTWSGKPLETAE